MQLAFDTRDFQRSAAQTVKVYKIVHKLRQDPFSGSSAVRISEKFKATGSVLDAARSGRLSISDDVIEAYE